MKKKAGANNFITQQDSARCHTARIIFNLQKVNKVTFWGPETWAPNSSDMNPVDYFFKGK
ncbi:Uncharacterized protein FKW44_015573 [Caligus rogercresseyi]|uniref:Uncharacterized protein n=1 Tax=Caligus rogercresseyi TaxID=217165 RepID=A0A7T8JZS1_CALRO|nr:Uncharacterized protein FKW44_015573 [Caligus rogercresseyi]